MMTRKEELMDLELNKYFGNDNSDNNWIKL
jgi:hypothetical protein